MPLEQLLETTNVKNLDTPELGTRKQYIWDEISPSTIEKNHADIKKWLDSRGNSRNAGICAAALQLLNENWKVPEDVNKTIREFYQGDLNINAPTTRSIFPDVFVLQVVAPDLAADITSLNGIEERVKYEFGDTIRYVRQNNIKTGIGTLNTTNIFFLLQAKFAFPDIVFSEEEIQSIKNRVYTAIQVNEEKLKKGEPSLYDYLVSAAAYKYFYPEENFSIPDTMTPTIKRGISTSPVIQMIYCMLLKLIYATSVNYTEKGIQLVMPEEKSNKPTIPSLPVVKR